jgi:hypothetical protein
MSNEPTLREQREYPAILSPLGKAISGDEIRRTCERLIDRLQWCSSDEREIIVNWLSAHGLL